MPESFEGITVPPGEPGELRAAARTMANLVTALRGASAEVGALPGGLSWQGPAAGAYGDACVTTAAAAEDSAVAVYVAAAAIGRYAEELSEAKHDAREAIEDAKDARRRIDRAEARIEAARQSRGDAEARAIGASVELAVTGALGTPSAGAEVALRQAEADAQAAADEERQARGELEQARDDLERAKRRGERAEDRARHAARAAAGAFAMTGAMAGAPPPPPPPPKPAEDEPSFLEKTLSGALHHAGLSTPGLGVAEALDPGFTEDLAQGAIVDTAVGIKDLAVMGVQLAPAYRLIDAEGQDRKYGQLADTARYAYNDPWGFTKQATGISHAEDGHTGRMIGGWLPALATMGAGAAVRGGSFAGRAGNLAPDSAPAASHAARQLDGTRGSSSAPAHGQPTPYPHLAPHERWSPEQGTPVIGRLPDTEVAKDWPGHAVLDLDDWNLDKNDEWVQSIIDQRGEPYIGSPLTPENLWNPARGEHTVFGREVGQFTGSGYEFTDDLDGLRPRAEEWAPTPGR